MSMNHSSKQKPLSEEEQVTHLPTEYFFSSSRRLSTESNTPFVQRKTRYHQKSKTFGIKAAKKKFFNELSDNAYEILLTRTKQIEYTARTGEDWYDISDISDFDLNSSLM